MYKLLKFSSMMLRIAFLVLLVVAPLQLSAHEEYEPCKFRLKPAKKDKVLNFDLSRLQELQSLILEPSMNTEHKSVLLLFSFCSPLYNVSSLHLCDRNASSCLISRDRSGREDFELIRNAGMGRRLINGTEKSLDIEMVGSTCIADDGTRKNFSTYFHLHCEEKEPQRVFMVGSWLDHCEVQVHWISHTFCPVPETSPCKFNVDEGFEVNLNQLRSPTLYAVQDAAHNKSYELNICGPIQGGLCNASAACEIDVSSNKTTVLGYPETMGTIHTHNDGLLIVYSETIQGRRTLEIQLLCVPGNVSAAPVIYFSGIHKKRKRFTMETPIACIKNRNFCKVISKDSGDQFDLSAIGKAPLKILAEVAPRVTSLIHLSVCSSFDGKYNESSCVGPGVSVCEMGADGNQQRILGMLDHEPVLTRNDSVEIIYPNGDLCNSSKIGERYKTHLLLICDTGAAASGSDAFAEMIGCTLFISFPTKAACPTEVAEGKDCTLQDPVIHNSFDLKGLRSQITDYEQSWGTKDSVRINVCGPLVIPCNGRQNVSVCLHREGREIAIGETATDLKFEDGILKFDLSGDSCGHAMQKSKTVVSLLCDSSVSSISYRKSMAVMYDEGTCVMHIVWKTMFACPPYSETPNCFTNGSGNHWYDLRPLSNQNRNYEVSDKFRLNVCRSISYSQESMCSSTTGVCMVDYASKGKKKFINAGSVGNGPYFDNKGILRIDYANGDLCKSGKQNHHTSSIRFTCSRPIMASGPVFDERLSTDCHHEFSWSTPEACPVYSVNRGLPNDQFVVDDCGRLMVDRFDLSELKLKLWQVKATPAPGQSKLEFYIGICRGLTYNPNAYDSRCTNAAICMVDDSGSYSLGNVSSNVAFSSHHGVLFYNNGTNCDSITKYTSEISFVCTNQYFPREGPQYVRSLGCHHIFVFYTPLACGNENEIHTCVAQNNLRDPDYDIHLHKLMQATTPYRVEDTDGRVFLLNVCGQLPKIAGIECADGSSSCMFQKNSSEHSLNLGYFVSPPSFEYLPGSSSPQIILKYTGGDLCAKRLERQISASTSIRFICDPEAGVGKPKFVSKKAECTYQFVWRTNVVCLDERMLLDREKCIIRDFNNIETFDLTQLYPEDTLRLMKEGVRPPPTGENMFIYLCNWTQKWMQSENFIECHDSAVCDCSDVKGNCKGYGYQPHVYFDSANDTVKVFFRGSYRHECSSQDTTGAEIWFTCSKSFIRHPPKLLAVSDCHLIIEWPTNIMCPEHLRYPDDPFGGSSLRQTWIVMAVIMCVTLFGFGFGVVFVKLRWWAALRSRVNRLFGYKHSSLVQYSADAREDWTEFDSLQ